SVLQDLSRSFNLSRNFQSLSAGGRKPNSMNHKSQYLRGKRIDPAPIHPDLKIPDLVDQVFCAYNAARLREACHLYAKQMLDDGVTVGMTLSGALSPAGMGISTFIPLIE